MTQDAFDIGVCGDSSSSDFVDIVDVIPSCGSERGTERGMEILRLNAAVPKWKSGLVPFRFEVQFLCCALRAMSFSSGEYTRRTIQFF